MTNDPTHPDYTTPENVEAHTETAQPPTGTEGDNPASAKTAPADTASAGKDAEGMDLTPEGLSDEPAKQEDPASVVKPENS
ncbi:hypothetical protein F8G81_18555 [Arthrobacter sp. CDRTa11]|uniref:hypothetical protein n=1 Tax=Arthrobacter sp. CDRTa11 TaxID=2651199 RepID=UPI002265D9BB|nr:hypothetical protein [Arthrobacter sp. CDRTa11]UZX04388.1 hypothetical protein F8G81_18555 [Arthrobacter sp. CDRTa11]